MEDLRIPSRGDVESFLLARIDAIYRNAREAAQQYVDELVRLGMRDPLARDFMAQGGMVKIGSLNVARAAMEALSDGERLAVMNQYCKECGSKDTGCQCWNDD
jgi:hypothetical protein